MELFLLIVPMWRRIQCRQQLQYYCSHLVLPLLPLLAMHWLLLPFSCTGNSEPFFNSSWFWLNSSQMPEWPCFFLDISRRQFLAPEISRFINHEFNMTRLKTEICKPSITTSYWTWLLQTWWLDFIRWMSTQCILSKEHWVLTSLPLCFSSVIRLSNKWH